jgi:CheY-like chemotaxis protein
VDDLVVLVEDSERDVGAVRRALARSHPLLRVEHIADGALVPARLLATDRQRPGMVLLDLDLAGTDGRSVLAAIRARPELADLPVVVLTTSTSPRDVEQCYSAGANSYLFKPVNFELLQNVLSGAVEYWLRRGHTAPA